MLVLGRVRNLCLLLGLLDVTLIGFGAVGVNFQASLFYVMFLAALWLLLWFRRIRLGVYGYGLWFLGLGLAIFFSVTTNILVVGVTYVVVTFLTTMLMLLLFENHLPQGPIQYVQGLYRYGEYIVSDGLSWQYLKEFFAVKKEGFRWKIKPDIVYGLLVAAPIVIVFHFLFSRVNVDYALFVSHALESIWKVIKFILDIDLLWILLQGLIEAYVLYVLFMVRHTKENDQAIAEQLPLVIVKVVLAAVVGLFLLFSSFQTKLLFLDVFKLAFKEVSQYVQKGFLELLAVSVGGYGLAILALSHLPKEPTKEQTHIRYLLAIFCVELVVIAVFIFHKLYALQAVFGFKDQRILASTAILLILVTFIFLLLRVVKRMSAGQIFRRQVLLLLGLVLLLNIANVDLVVSKYNTIRYDVGDKQYKDYSYLLGNSYDNVSEWQRLMQEAAEVGVPQPDKDYYWGHFSPSRKDFYGGVYSPIYERQEVVGKGEVCHSYLKDRYQQLTSKYDSFNLKMPLKKMTNINWHEYQAYVFVKSNREMIAEFIEFAKGRCAQGGQ